MAAAALFAPDEPLGEINTTPLIDVLLVLLVMLILTVPIATHSVEVALPGDGPGKPDARQNSLVITADDAILWNGTAVTRGELAGLLGEVHAMKPEPQVRFEPDAQASYDRAAKVMQTVERSGVSNFGFVGNERHRRFGSD